MMKALIREEILTPRDFEATALALYKWQKAHNPVYKRIAGGQTPSRWQDIPTVPVALFRDLNFTCFDPQKANHQFHTSGTTGRPGIHRLFDTEIYDLAARQWAQTCIGPLPKHGISLVSHAPQSSLGHMCQSFVPQMPSFFNSDGLDTHGAWDALKTAHHPVFVPGTAFAFDALIKANPSTCPLPPGSVVMVTGGFKGHSHTVSHSELFGELERIFAGTRLVSEYGMTELSSQLWADPADGPFSAPPWMGVYCVDPWSKQLKDEGLLCFVDLANHQTVLAIETRDTGRIESDGRVTLLGRLPGSPTRGCSLTVEEACRINMPTPTTTHVIPAPRPRDEPNSLDHRRAQRVVEALQILREDPAQPLSDGLSKPNATLGLQSAIDSITLPGLLATMTPRHQRPKDVGLICARGVFTAPLEWLAMLLSAGCQVHLKAPHGADAFAVRVCEVFVEAGFSVTVSTQRALPKTDAIIAFGSDLTLTTLQQQYPTTPLVGFGHRFSVSWTRGQRLAQTAQDIAMYDTRGCMAPTAIFTDTDPEKIGEQLSHCLERMEISYPRGDVAIEHGPEWRRRCAIAQSEGKLWRGDGWAVAVIPARHFSPSTLPRMAVIHPVDNPTELKQRLRPLGHWLSTLSVDTAPESLDGVLKEVALLFPRTCLAGEMQTPPFPRRHDNKDMTPCMALPLSAHQ